MPSKSNYKMLKQTCFSNVVNLNSETTKENFVSAFSIQGALKTPRYNNNNNDCTTGGGCSSCPMKNNGSIQNYPGVL
jgi:hypothetical protein